MAHDCPVARTAGHFLWASIGGRLPRMGLTYPKKPEPLHTHEGKLRRCLMCRQSFTSSWPGERVCPRCKTTINWRDGPTLRDGYE